MSLLPAIARRSIRPRGPPLNDGTPASAAFGYSPPSLHGKRVVNTGFRMVLEWKAPLSAPP